MTAFGAYYAGGAMRLGATRTFAAWERYRRVAEELDGLGEDLLVLDVGCGPGYVARMVAPRHRVVGVDIALEPLDEFAHFGLAVAADALALPFEEEVFDVVVCTQTLYHLPLDASLAELARVLRRGGRLLIEQGGAVDFSMWPTLAYWAIRRRLPGRFRLTYPSGRARWRTLRRALAAAGLQPIKRVGLEISTGPLYHRGIDARLGLVSGEFPAFASQQLIVAERL